MRSRARADRLAPFDRRCARPAGRNRRSGPVEQSLLGGCRPLPRRIAFSRPATRAVCAPWVLRPCLADSIPPITFDNDTAFAQHTLLRTMRDMATWFCDAYVSWQKGRVEDAHGRLRRWLPRQIDIDRLSDEEIQDIVITANHAPRKCLGYKTRLRGSSKSSANTSKFGFRRPLRIAPESTKEACNSVFIVA